MGEFYVDKDFSRKLITGSLEVIGIRHKLHNQTKAPKILFFNPV